MKILAIEFSTNLRSVALLDGPPLGARPVETSAIRLLVEQSAATPKEACAIGMVDAALSAAGMEREEIDGIVIGIGPGSYTGVRIAIALAQGWQLARPIVTLGISAMDCLAAQFVQKKTGRFWVALDAQRGDFYLAGGETKGTDWRWMEPLHLASGEETRAKIDTGGIPIGPDIARWFPDGWTLHPAATMMGRLAWLQGTPVPANQLEPIYLREISYVKAPPPRQIPVA